MKSPAQIFAQISSETRASSGREAEEQDWMRSCVSRGKGIWSTLPVAYNSATCGQGAAASLHAPASSCTTASGLKGCCTDVAAHRSIATGPIDAAICAALPNDAAEFEIGRSRAAGLCVVELSTTTAAGRRNFFFYACSGQRQFSNVSFSGFGLWVRVLGSVYHNRFPNSNPNLNHNSNRNITLTPILTPNSS